MKGFLVAADAIVPCKTCGAAEGVPCKGKGLKRNYVHIGRRVSRLLLSARRPEKREEFEAAAVKELHKFLREKRR